MSCRLLLCMATYVVFRSDKAQSQQCDSNSANGCTGPLVRTNPSESAARWPRTLETMCVLSVAAPPRPTATAAAADVNECRRRVY
jgi:hypothetical protein